MNPLRKPNNYSKHNDIDYEELHKIYQAMVIADPTIEMVDKPCSRKDDDYNEEDGWDDDFDYMQNH